MRSTTASRNARSCEATTRAPARVAERLLEPLDRGHVQVVRGLVEHQQVDFRDQQPSQRGPSLLTARQLCRRSRPLDLREAKPGERGVHAHVQRVAAARLEVVAQMLVLGRLDGRCAGRLELGQAPFHLDQRDCARTDGVTHGRRGRESRVQVRLLGREAHAQAARPEDTAAVGLVDAGGQPQQRRLARTVGADQADTFVARDRHADRVEDDLGTDLPMGGLQPQDRHYFSFAGLRPATREAVGLGRLARSRPSLIPSSTLSVAGVLSRAGRRWHHEQK